MALAKSRQRVQDGNQIPIMLAEKSPMQFAIPIFGDIFFTILDRMVNCVNVMFRFRDTEVRGFRRNK
jgi:hypothetical protein